jgi:hypothetical protein
LPAGARTPPRSKDKSTRKKERGRAERGTARPRRLANVRSVVDDDGGGRHRRQFAGPVAHRRHRPSPRAGGARRARAAAPLR